MWQGWASLQLSSGNMSSASAVNLGGLPEVVMYPVQWEQDGGRAAVRGAHGVPGTHWLGLLLQGGSEMKH